MMTFDAFWPCHSMPALPGRLGRSELAAEQAQGATAIPFLACPTHAIGAQKPDETLFLGLGRENGACAAFGRPIPRQPPKYYSIEVRLPAQGVAVTWNANLPREAEDR